jgi:hypothetical protein
MKATLLAALFLGLVCFVGAFDENFQITQFLDSQPHPIIRADFDFHSEAASGGNIEIQLIADLGPFKLPYGDPDYYEIRYDGSEPGYMRNVKIWLRTPSGANNIYLGKFFDSNTYNDGAYLIDSGFYDYDSTDGSVYFYNNFNYDYGYYNTRNILSFYVDPSVWQQIVREGSVSLLFEFSPEVNSYYLIYPFNVPYNDIYPFEDFLQVHVHYLEAAVVGDPHFRGWNGEKFDFQGENHHIYNLISHRDTQINFQMKQRNFFSVSKMEDMESLAHNTFVGTIGLKSKSHQLVLFSGESGFEDAGYIELDGVRHEITRENKLVHSDSELTVQFSAPTSDLHQGKDPVAAVMDITCGIYKLRVFFIESGRNLQNLAEWHSHPFRYFNTYASITEKNPLLRGRMHGVLGQTGDQFLSQKASGAENWSIEGLIDDYRVSDLFASDFQYNLFAHRKN